MFLVPLGFLAVDPVQKCDGSVFFSFPYKFDVLVDGVEMGVQLCKMFTSDTNMTFVNIHILPLRRLGCGI